MNETIKNLRAIADHVERFDLPALSGVDPKPDIRILLWARENGWLVPFLQWVDSLGESVEITGSGYGNGYHLYAHGVISNGSPAKVVAVVGGPEFSKLVEEIGYNQKEIPIHRDLLAKIADPELLDDRAAVTP